MQTTYRNKNKKNGEQVKAMVRGTRGEGQAIISISNDTEVPEEKGRLLLVCDNAKDPNITPSMNLVRVPDFTIDNWVAAN